jgi:hypothetical protein
MAGEESVEIPETSPEDSPREAALGGAEAAIGREDGTCASGGRVLGGRGGDEAGATTPPPSEARSGPSASSGSSSARETSSVWSEAMSTTTNRSSRSLA